MIRAQNAIRARWSNIDAVFGIPLCIAAFIYLALGLDKQHLWLDEVCSATYSAQSFLDVAVSTLRFDAHPPIYYLQLALWSGLGNSDYFLLLNSVVWTVIAAASLSRLRVGNLSRSALWGAALVFVAMPVTLRYAHELRMYAFVTALTVWLAIAIERATARELSKKDLAIVAALELCICYSYVGASVILASAATYGLLLVSGRPSRDILRWFGIQVGVGIAAAPAIVNSMLRSTTEPPLPGPAEVIATIGHLTIGPLSASGLGSISAGVLFVAVLIFGCRDPRTRPLALAMVLLPYAMVFAISHTIKSAWLDRSLLFTTPFFCILAVAALCALLDRLETLLHRIRANASTTIAVLLLAVILAGSSAIGGDFFMKPTNYRAAAATVAAGLRPGDIIYVPENISFWGIARYLVGPQWGSPLAIQDPVAPDFSDKWSAILRSLGLDWRRRLHLEPISRSITSQGVPMIIGWTRPNELGQAERVWLITHSTTRGLDIPALPGFVESGTSDYTALTVRLMIRSDK